MKITITIKFNRDRIAETKVETSGFTGESCLLATDKLRAANPSAILEPTQEMYEEEPPITETTSVGR